MRGNLAAAFKYTGTILLAFGIVFSVIELMGARYGSHHPGGVLLAVGLVAVGALLSGASFMMQRSGRNT